MDINKIRKRERVCKKLPDMYKQKIFEDKDT